MVKAKKLKIGRKKAVFFKFHQLLIKQFDFDLSRINKKIKKFGINSKQGELVSNNIIIEDFLYFGG